MDNGSLSLISRRQNERSKWEGVRAVAVQANAEAHMIKKGKGFPSQTH